MRRSGGDTGKQRIEHDPIDFSVALLTRPRHTFRLESGSRPSSRTSRIVGAADHRNDFWARPAPCWLAGAQPKEMLKACSRQPRGSGRSSWSASPFRQRSTKRTGAGATSCRPATVREPKRSSPHRLPRAHVHAARHAMVRHRPNPADARQASAHSLRLPRHGAPCAAR